MPRKKISLSDISVEDAFAVLQRHGLNVEVKSLQEDSGKADIADFLQSDKANDKPLPEKVSNSKTRITLYTQHTIACSGDIVGEGQDKRIEGASVATYGPGTVTVPTYLATQLLHQDGLARQAEADLLETRSRRKLIVPYGSSSRVIDLGFGDSNLSSMLDGTNRAREFTF